MKTGVLKQPRQRQEIRRQVIPDGIVGLTAECLGHFEHRSTRHEPSTSLHRYKYSQHISMLCKLTGDTNSCTFLGLFTSLLPMLQSVTPVMHISCQCCSGNRIYTHRSNWYTMITTYSYWHGVPILCQTVAMMRESGWLQEPQSSKFSQNHGILATFAQWGQQYVSVTVKFCVGYYTPNFTSIDVRV